MPYVPKVRPRLNGPVSAHIRARLVADTPVRRSCDVFLGMPFNIVQYSLLTHLLADFTGLKPGEFVYSMGHYHIYLNHIDAASEQLTRIPTEYPTLQIKSRPPKDDDLSDYNMEDIVLLNYKPQGKITAVMAV